jgi:drug/metabolite transporter (DMT)-like permease
VVGGTVLGFGAYTWLLRVTSAAAVSTYAFVNPVVAVILGSLLHAEPITPAIVAGAIVIVAAVAFIVWRQNVQRGTTARAQVATAAD